MKKSKKFIALCKKYGVNPDNINEVMSFEDGCKITGDDPTKLPIVKGVAKRHQKRLIADYKLSIISEALRNNIVPDYTNTNEYKYFPVFRVEATKENKSGSGLSYYGYDCWSSASFVGVRLCLPNRDAVKFCALHFAELYTDHQLYT